MERLTAYNSGNHKNVAYYPVCFEYPCNGFGCKIDGCKPDYEICQKLAAYEDTGLEPEEIKELLTDDVAEAAKMFRKMIESGEINHLKDLLQAEKDGRLVVLPCKVGDTVYVIDKGDYTHAFKPYVRPKPVREISWKATSKKDLGWGMILSGGDCGTSARYKLSSIGKTVFLTREEAEAALVGKGGAK